MITVKTRTNGKLLLPIWVTFYPQLRSGDFFHFFKIFLLLYLPVVLFYIEFISRYGPKVR